MRYAKGHKEATRRLILETAAKRFRADGVTNVGVDGVMNDVGLTHGGFYSHFESKEALFNEAILDALKGTFTRLAVASKGQPGGLEGILRTYLESTHRDDPGTGCSFPVLAADIARQPAGKRAVFAQALHAFVQLIAHELPQRLTEQERLARANAIFGLMIGALQMSRICVSTKEADSILEASIEAALIIARRR